MSQLSPEHKSTCRVASLGLGSLAGSGGVVERWVGLCTRPSSVFGAGIGWVIGTNLFHT